MEKLLNKKGWTGAELGKLSIANLMLGYKRVLENNNQNEELDISKEDIRKMVNTLKDPSEKKTYNGYMDIYEWIVRNLQVAVSQEQQAQLQHRILLNIVSNALVAEDVYGYIDQLPLIMTEKQFNETVDKRTQEIINPKGGIEDNIQQLIFTAIEYYIQQLKTNPNAKNPLKPLKKKLEKELVKDPNILENYNEIAGYGYYSLEDGTRSDQVSDEEWSTALGYDDISNSEIIRRHTETASIMFKNGVTEEEAEQIRQEQDEKDGKAKKCEWHYYDKAPEDLNKWEILESGDLYEYYTDTKTREHTIELAKAFADEFPEVTEAILEDIAINYPTLKYVKELSPEEWLELDKCPTWEILYKLDFYGFKNNYTDIVNIFDGQPRAVLNGVAILKPSRFSSNIDKETGYFSPPDIRSTLAGYYLESYFPESEDYAQNIDFIEDLRETFTASLYYLKAFDLCLELISSMYGIEEILIARPHVGFIEAKAKDLNNLIYMLHKRIESIRYENKELKKKKLEVLQNILYPIDLSKIVIPKKRLERTKEAIKDFKAFTDDRLNPSNLLCIYDPEALKEALENGEGA